jgi:hypothetical protein
MQGLWHRWFIPHEEVQMVTPQSAKGLFIPWPLLGIIVTLAIVLITGLVTIEVQVNNLSTTLLLRDNDHSRQIEDLKAADLKNMQDIKAELAKETDKREVTDLKVADLREKQAARGLRRN